MSGKIEYELSAHAERVLVEREIAIAWVERVLCDPQRVEPDAVDPMLRHALGRIPERGDRVLRVIYNQAVQLWRIVTAYFDRAMRGQL